MTRVLRDFATTVVRYRHAWLADYHAAPAPEAPDLTRSRRAAARSALTILRLDHEVALQGAEAETCAIEAALDVLGAGRPRVARLVRDAAARARIHRA